MDLIPYLSTVILIATIATILLAVLSYAVFKLRDRRRSRDRGAGPAYFHRYLPADAAESAQAALEPTGEPSRETAEP